MLCSGFAFSYYYINSIFSTPSSFRSPRSIDLAGLSFEEVSHQKGLAVKKTILGANEVPHILNFGQARLRPGQKVNLHVHPSKFEVFHCLSGEGIISISPSRGNGLQGASEIVNFSIGITTVVRPKEYHEISNVNNQDDLVFLYFGVEA